MADHRRKARKDSRKYCLSYFENSVCNKDKCKYIHKKCPFLEVDTVNIKEGYVMGRVNHSSVCRFYLRGDCTQGSSCRFRHDNETSSETEDTTLNNNLNNDYSLPPSSTHSLGAPSTSGNETVLQELITDFSEQNSNNTKNNYAGIFPSTDSEDDDNSQAKFASFSPQPPTVDGATWANAPEFVPKHKTTNTKTYAAACNSGPRALIKTDSDKKLCSFVAKTGHCKFPPGECIYLHGDICDLCGNAVLHPQNEEMRRIHYTECIKQHEKNMEHSFAIARSKDKTCGICFEVIMEKASGEQRFGILPNCNHCFCLICIRKWRQAHQFENKIIRACPECRVTSDFVCPSSYWVDTKEDKDKLINDYKKALSTKDCKYFKRGTGTCPFGNKCFYRHAFPDGRICDVGPPPRQRRIRSTLESEELGVFQVILWDFIDERDTDPAWQVFVEDLEELFTDSEDSDWSDYEIFLDY